MANNDIIQELKDNLGKIIIKFTEKSPKRIYIDIDKKDLREAARIIFNRLGARFIIVSGVDLVDKFEMLYHFQFDKLNKVVSFRVELKKGHFEIDSLAPLFKGAEWIEREIHELLGIDFKGHPDLRPLLSSEEWQPNEHPLRKKK